MWKGKLFCYTIFSMKHADCQTALPSLFSWKNFWDLWCIVSVAGIWPRFIEPFLLSTTKIDLPIKNLPKDLSGLKLLHLTDLHFHASMKPQFLHKILSTIESLSPDLILFTGDFLCHSRLEAAEQLRTFLSRMKAPYGCYAVLGNHDYQQYVSINTVGDYDVMLPPTARFMPNGFKRLFPIPQITGNSSPRILAGIQFHEKLRELLEDTPFQLLNNKCIQIPIKGSLLNVCGLEDYTARRMEPQTAFSSYDSRYPGVVLVHNPDAFPALKNYPGELVLCGHTHGAQVNLPFLRHRLTLMENPHWLRGLFQMEEKWMYVNRGVGATMDFRWFSRPEICVITLREKSWGI